MNLSPKSALKSAATALTMMAAPITAEAVTISYDTTISWAYNYTSNPQNLPEFSVGTGINVFIDWDTSTNVATGSYTTTNGDTYNDFYTVSFRPLYGALSFMSTIPASGTGVQFDIPIFNSATTINEFLEELATNGGKAWAFGFGDSLNGVTANEHNGQFTLEGVEMAAVPTPSSGALMGGALLALGAAVAVAGRRRKDNALTV